MFNAVKGVTLWETASAWDKLTIMLRFRFTERIDEIERLAEVAGVDVSWAYAYEQEIEGEPIVYGVVNSVKTC